MLLRSAYTGAPIGYDNTDIITVVNVDGVSNGVVTFTTNSTGGNLVFTVANTGRAFSNSSNYIIQVTNSSGGTATGNNDATIFSATFTNVTSNSILSYANQNFGTIYNLSEVKPGKNYTQPVDVFVRSTQLSKALTGNVSYNTASSNVTGTNTVFTDVFSNGDVIYLQANSSANSGESQVIKTVVNATSVVLYGPPSKNSTSTAIYKAAPVILPSQFAPYEKYMARKDGTINGVNEIITAVPSTEIGRAHV